MEFTQGRIIFALSFIVGFAIILIFAYRKDLSLHRIHYKGATKIIAGIFLALLLFFWLKNLVLH
jgi:hypothetical protein